MSKNTPDLIPEEPIFSSGGNIGNQGQLSTALFDIDSDEVVDNVENFFEKNWKIIAAGLAAITIGIAGYYFLKSSKASSYQEGLDKSYVADFYFGKDSFNLSLVGDKTNWGYKKIADEYSGTPLANQANYNAGVCCLRLGKFQEAIGYFEKYTADDMLLSAFAIGQTGDAYIELGKTQEGLDNYLKAADKSPNDLTSPYYLQKAAGIQEDLKQYDKALATYKRIQTDYYTTEEGRKAAKYIAKLEASTAK